MPDISKCNNQDCIKREMCYRFTCKSSEYRQAWGEFAPNRNLPQDFYCRWFILDEKANKK